MIRRVLVLFAALLALEGPTPVVAQTTLRVVACNIRHGRGMDGEVDLERIAAVLNALDPDVVTLQEVDRGTARTFGVDQTARLAELTGLAGFFGDHRAYDGGEYGNAVLTRIPVVGVLVTERLEEDWFIIPKDGERYTFPADEPDREIDYIMLRPAGVFEIVEHRVVQEELASDHRPLLATLRIW